MCRHLHNNCSHVHDDPATVDTETPAGTRVWVSGSACQYAATLGNWFHSIEIDVGSSGVVSETRLFDYRWMEVEFGADWVRQGYFRRV